MTARGILAGAWVLTVLGQSPSAAAQTACPDGQEISRDTAGHCCWPGQGWSRGRQVCVGIPRCPNGLHVQGESCSATCPSGQAVSAETRGHCCWPRQLWSSEQNRCVGIPACPAGTRAEGESCAAASPSQAVAPTAVAPAANAGPGVYTQRYGGSTPVDVVNNFDEDICGVEMGPSSDPNWGDNWLLPGERIQVGQARQILIRGGQNWDFRARLCNGSIAASVMHSNVPDIPTQIVLRSNVARSNAAISLVFGPIFLGGGITLLTLLFDGPLRNGDGLDYLMGFLGGFTGITGFVMTVRGFALLGSPAAAIDVVPRPRMGWGPRATPLRLGFGFAPTPGGAAVTLGASF